MLTMPVNPYPQCADTPGPRTYCLAIALNRFFEIFSALRYKEIELPHHLYYQFLVYLQRNWPVETLLARYPPVLSGPVLAKSDLFGYIDRPYPPAAPGGAKILMRAGFIDTFQGFVPDEAMLLYSPHQAEVDLVESHTPFHPINVEKLYVDDSEAVRDLANRAAALCGNLQEDMVFGSPSFQHWLTGQLGGAVKRLNAVAQLFAANQVGAAVTISAAHWAENAVLLTARARGIPSITLQHGLIGDNPASHPFANLPFFAKMKAVWGEAFADWFTAYGVPADRVCVTGSPRFDMIFDRRWADQQETARLLDLPADRPYVVVTTQPRQVPEFVRVINQAAKALPDITFVLKLHPAEKVESYQALVHTDEKLRLVKFGAISLYDLLPNALACITRWSTSAIEAMLFHCPLICYEPADSVYEYSFVQKGAALPAANAANLILHLKRLQQDPAYRAQAQAMGWQYCIKHCVPDSQASARFVAMTLAAMHAGS